jgi:hypothetical protein
MSSGRSVVTSCCVQAENELLTPDASDNGVDREGSLYLRPWTTTNPVQRACVLDDYPLEARDRRGESPPGAGRIKDLEDYG